jgi:hypothetical protein
MAVDFSDAAAYIRSTLEQWGLGTMASVVLGYVQGGDSVDVAVAKLRETNEYKTRFKANEIRRQKGLPALTEAEYLSTEASYRSVMRSYGLPEGFYDSYDDFQKFLGEDVSPQEMRDKVVEASERYIFAPQEDKDQFIRAGLTPGEAIATILDPLVATPLIKQRITAIGLAAEAQRAFDDRERLSVERSNELAQLGVTREDARRGFGELAASQENDLQLARMAGEDLSTRELEDEALLGRRSVSADRARTQARNDFQQSYVGTETGLTRNTGGSY